MNENNKEFEELNKRFPFLTYAKYGEKEYIGIIQNMDNTLVSMYAMDKMNNTDVKTAFLNYGEVWWWESNRLIPINMFIGPAFKQFAPYLLTFAIKDYTRIIGPEVCTDNITSRRVKRRSVQLIRKID